MASSAAERLEPRGRTDAAGFIEALAYGAPVTFQTFDDRGQDRSLARIFHGSYEDVKGALRSLNEQGAGVFVCVAQTDGNGRRAENVTRLRALFTDDDGPGHRAFRRCCPPSFIVRSVGGPHCYWRLKYGERLDRFGHAQKQLARFFGTDPKVCDLPRVMRVPGFWHHKGEPQMVTWEPVAIVRQYTIDEVLAAYPAPTPATPTRQPVPPPALDPDARSKNWWHFLERPILKGERNRELFRIACGARRRGRDYGLVLDGIREINATLCEKPLTDDEIEGIVASAMRY